MTKPTLPSPRSKLSKSIDCGIKTNPRRRRARKAPETSDVLVSAVISTHLLTHLHHVLQRAEYGAAKEGRNSMASNFAQLRKVLCMDARSMEDASAIGIRENDFKKMNQEKVESKVA